MPEKEVIYADSFLNKNTKIQSVPEGAHLICAYHVHIGIDSFEEPACIWRINGTDELWISDYFGRHGIAFVIRCKGSIESACPRLLDILVRSRVGFYWPTRFVTSGLLDEEAFNDLVKRIENELDENAEHARKNKPEIAYVAEELGLYTRPTGTSEEHWKATCPETNHSLELQASNNLFFCGYCNRSGGIDDLKKFVKERRNG